MLTEEDRRRAADMTEDPMVQDVDDVADVLRRHVDHITKLDARVSELITERDGAMEDLHRLTDAFECSEHPDAIHMVRCTACGKERHVPA